MVDNSTKFLANLKSRKAEKTVDIGTPMGPFPTSESKALELERFFIENGEKYVGPMGGQYSYEFTPTSMGLMLIITDCVSKNKIDVTDILNW